MTAWEFWWLEAGDDEHGGWQGGFVLRGYAILDAQRALPVGAQFSIIEARSSTAAKHEGADCVPFVRTRNREMLTNGPA